MTDVTAPAYAPLGGTSVSGTAITVDMLTTPPEIIPQLVRDFTSENQGYFIEDIYAVPAGQLRGSAVIVTPTLPEDQFLDSAKDIEGRAPGADSPTIGGKRREPVIYRPKSWAGKIEVTDEARRWNLVEEVTNDFRRAANSFADKVQTDGLNAIKDFIASTGRTMSSISWTDAAAASGGVINVARTTQPTATFRAVLEQFIEDKTGVRPDTVIMNQQEGTSLTEVWDDKVAAILARFGITNVYETPEMEAGKAWFVKKNQVGSIRFDKTLEQEYQRGPAGTWKDVYAMEIAPVFALIDAGSILEVTGLAA